MESIRSAYRGVSFDRKKRKFRVQIKVTHLGKSGISVGYFSSELDAARAYDRAAIALLGRENSSLVTNYPLQDYAEEQIPCLIGKDRDIVKRALKNERLKHRPNKGRGRKGAPTSSVRPRSPLPSDDSDLELSEPEDNTNSSGWQGAAQALQEGPTGSHGPSETPSDSPQRRSLRPRDSIRKPRSYMEAEFDNESAEEHGPDAAVERMAVRPDQRDIFADVAVADTETCPAAERTVLRSNSNESHTLQHCQQLLKGRRKLAPDGWDMERQVPGSILVHQLSQQQAGEAADAPAAEQELDFAGRLDASTDLYMDHQHEPPNKRRCLNAVAEGLGALEGSLPCDRQTSRLRDGHWPMADAADMSPHVVETIHEDGPEYRSLQQTMQAQGYNMDSGAPFRWAELPGSRSSLAYRRRYPPIAPSCYCQRPIIIMQEPLLAEPFNGQYMHTASWLRLMAEGRELPTPHARSMQRNASDGTMDRVVHELMGELTDAYGASATPRDTSRWVDLGGAQVSSVDWEGPQVMNALAARLTPAAMVPQEGPRDFTWVPPVPRAVEELGGCPTDDVLLGIAADLHYWNAEP